MTGTSASAIRGGASHPSVTVVYRRTNPGQVDGIDEYSRRLAGALNAAGLSAQYVPDGLRAAIGAGHPADWLLLQYNPFRYGRAGFAPRLIWDVARLRLRSRARLAVMVHEAWIDLTDVKSIVVGLWQRLQLRTILRFADVVMTSTAALAAEIGAGAVHIPVATNITRVSATSEVARELLGLNGGLTVALFGTDHPSRALGFAEAAIAAVADRHGADQVTVLNLGDGAPRVRVPAGVNVVTPGQLPADEVSLHLAASDLVLLPFVDGVSTRRGTMMAALAHGRAVVGLEGRNTDPMLKRAPDALVLTAADDERSYARAAVEVADDEARRQMIGDAALRFYERNLDWPVLAKSVISLLESGATTGSTRQPQLEIVFVGHDIGGAGGMERHTDELITRLLASGVTVTVVSRTCQLEPHPALCHKRVRTPSRPFPIAFPAFFIVGSILASRRKGPLVHSTGAIVGNHVDLSTVHYCHSAAQGRADVLRKSRSGPLYSLNARVANVLSRTAELWCYRPGRTRLLCPVSSGVAAELESRFPAMSRRIATVPNGVDADRFHPDAGERQTARAELGVDDETSLVVFVGGDWQRKGLIHAVDALKAAPGWHLAVAGDGDREPLLARAEAAGTAARISFLGAVKNTPRLYRAADAFVLPTAYEAFPLVALEAAASALPLLITPVHGARELVADGAGWYVERTGEDIAKRLNELRASPELAIRMSVAARAAAKRYTWDAMARSYLHLYQEVSEQPRRPR